MYSYKPLEIKLKEFNLTKTDLINRLGISSRTIAKINKGEKISDFVLNKISILLKCNSEELYQYIYDNHLLQILTEEKNAKLSGGLYHELQVLMTYNSNHIEGSTLNEDQTRMIFETQTIDASEGVPINDIIETVNHFRCIDYVIDVAMKPLSEDIIKHLHYLLKRNTKDEDLSYFKVGDYKTKSNVVGGKPTCKPSEVATSMQKLLANYLLKDIITINDIVEFHAEFELIHPFQDGNGRVGRLIILKECLKNNIIPLIIEDQKKMFYYRGLSKWKEDHAWLIDTFLDGQDTFKQLLKILDIPEK